MLPILTLTREARSGTSKLVGVLYARKILTCFVILVRCRFAQGLVALGRFGCFELTYMYPHEDPAS